MIFPRCLCFYSHKIDISLRIELVTLGRRNFVSQGSAFGTVPLNILVSNLDGVVFLFKFSDNLKLKRTVNTLNDKVRFQT